MAINVVLEDPQLTVLGPPAQVELNVNSGETGPRGSYIYSGSGNPNTNTLLTDKILGDLFLRTDTGPDYGAIYQYSSLPGGTEWIKILDFTPTEGLSAFLASASVFATSAFVSATSASVYAVSASNSAACALYLINLNDLPSYAASAAYWAGVSEQFSIDAAASAAYWVDIAEQNALSASSLYVTRDNEINTIIDFRSASVMFNSSSVSGFTFSGIDDATAIAYASSASANADTRALSYANSASANADTRALSYATSASANADTRALSYATSASANADTRALSYANSASANADTRALSYATSASANADTRALSYANSASANADTRALSYANSASANVATRSVSKTGDTMSGILTAQNYNITTASVSSNTIALDFSTGEGLQTVNVSSSVTFTGSNYISGGIKTVRIVSDGSSRSLTFPSGWIFVGSKPSSILANKNGILTVTSFGTNEQNCVAAWAVQS